MHRRIQSLFFTASFLTIFAGACGFLVMQARHHFLSLDPAPFDVPIYFSAAASMGLHSFLSLLRLRIVVGWELIVALSVLAVLGACTALAIPKRLARRRSMRRPQLIGGLFILLALTGIVTVYSSSRISEFLTVRPILLASTTHEVERAIDLRSTSETSAKNLKLAAFYTEKFDGPEQRDQILSIYDPRKNRDAARITHLFEGAAATTMACIVIFALSSLLFRALNDLHSAAIDWATSGLPFLLFVAGAMFLSVVHGYTRSIEHLAVISLEHVEPPKSNTVQLQGVFLLANTDQDITVFDRRSLEVIKLLRSEFPVLKVLMMSSPFVNCGTQPSEFRSCESLFW
jgi:hypothetical protein